MLSNKLFIIFGAYFLQNGKAYSLQNSKEFSTRQNFLINTASSITGVSFLGMPLSGYAEVPEDDYITTERGLKYKITSSPEDARSPSPQRGQMVKTTYTLYLNGFPEDTSSSKKVDSSKNPFFGEKPFEFLAGVSQVIKGWDLTVMDMKVGEGRRIIVPSELGYGERGAGGTIPPGATLYFDLTLVSLGDLAKIGPEQVKWLEEHPL